MSDCSSPLKVLYVGLTLISNNQISSSYFVQGKKVFIKNDFSNNLLFTILTKFIDISDVNDFINKLKYCSQKKSFSSEKPSYGELMDFSIKTNISNFHEDMLNRALYLVLIGPQGVGKKYNENIE
ncbi:hypothetical protein FG386_001665 [Cryptosporidium ryanae]|uniref:uncharacterized protein n=1 Tax=Cryptosporidium ryanae TaxID=515981 RepID=UPI00351A11D3|nr:hypothetical protein FG386_001665 [Cryptosporidium ryanae]